MYKGEEHPIRAGIDRMDQLRRLETETREIDRRRSEEVENDSPIESDPFFLAEQTEQHSINPPVQPRRLAARTPHHANVHLDPVTLAQYEEAFNAQPAQESFNVNSWLAEYEVQALREAKATVAQLSKSKLIDFSRDKKQRGQFILSLLRSTDGVMASFFEHFAMLRKTNSSSLPMSNAKAEILFHQMFEEHIQDLKILQEITECDFAEISPLTQGAKISANDVNEYSSKLYDLAIQATKDLSGQIGFSELISELDDFSFMFKGTKLGTIFAKIVNRTLDDQIVDYILELDKQNHSSDKVESEQLHAFLSEVEKLDALNTAPKSISDIFHNFFPQHLPFANPKSSPNDQSVKKIVDTLSTTELKLLLTDPKKKQDFLRQQVRSLLDQRCHFDTILKNKSELLDELMKRLSVSQEPLTDEDIMQNAMNFILALSNKYFKQVEQSHNKTGAYFSDNPNDNLACIQETIFRDHGTSLGLSFRHDSVKLWFDIFLRKMLPRICLQDFVESASASLEKGLENACVTAVKSLEGSIDDKRRQIREIEGRLFKSLKPAANPVSQKPGFWSEPAVEKLARLEKEDQSLTLKLERLSAASKSAANRHRL